MKVQEMGSEFWSVPTSEQENTLFLSSVQWFLSGRSALQTVVRCERDYLYNSERKKQPTGDLGRAGHLQGQGARHLEARACAANLRVTTEGNGRGRKNALFSVSGADVGGNIFRRDKCPPSDDKMITEL